MKLFSVLIVAYFYSPHTTGGGKEGKGEDPVKQRLPVQTTDRVMVSKVRMKRDAQPL